VGLDCRRGFLPRLRATLTRSGTAAGPSLAVAAFGGRSHSRGVAGPPPRLPAAWRATL